MNLLFDIGHPAHVHLFKNFIFYLKNNGHEVFVTSRDKDVTSVLLDYYKISHFSLSSPAKGKFGMLKELRSRNRSIFDLHLKNKFDASFGTSVSIGFLKQKYSVPSFNFNEDDDAVVRQYAYLAYPFATKIFNPDCIEFTKWKNKRVLYPSYHELAYLHPNNFKPDINIIKKYGLVEEKYVVVRLSALAAHHDVGAKGISSELLADIKNILSDYKVIESSELKKQYQIKPWDMHHVLAYAKMIICDSQTMAAEAMVLGTPSIRINSFVGKISYLEELENKYNLGFGIKPDNESDVLKTVEDMLNMKNIEETWQTRRQIMLDEKVDLNEWMINYFEKEICK